MTNLKELEEKAMDALQDLYEVALECNAPNCANHIHDFVWPYINALKADTEKVAREAWGEALSVCEAINKAYCAQSIKGEYDKHLCGLQCGSAMCCEYVQAFIDPSSWRRPKESLVPELDEKIIDWREKKKG